MLQRASLFIRGLPPELETWRRARASADTPEAGPPLLTYTERPLSRWRFAIQYGPGNLNAGATTTRLFGVNPLWWTV